MMFFTHLIFSLLIGLIFFKFNLILFLFILIGNFLPDLDSPMSKISRKFKFLSFLVKFFFSHRSFLHTIFPLVLFLFIPYNFVKYGLITGYLSHLFLDSLTLQGIKLFYPVSNFRLRGFVRVNSFLEYLLFLVLIIFLSFSLFKKFFII